MKLKNSNTRFSLSRFLGKDLFFNYLCIYIWNLKCDPYIMQSMHGVEFKEAQSSCQIIKGKSSIYCRFWKNIREIPFLVYKNTLSNLFFQDTFLLENIAASDLMALQTARDSPHHSSCSLTSPFSPCSAVHWLPPTSSEPWLPCHISSLVSSYPFAWLWIKKYSEMRWAKVVTFTD